VSPSRTFILRPVATSLMMAGVILVGVVAFRQLPVSALPQVDYPTIQIQTFYPGASPEVVTSSITAPLEKQFGQVPGLQQMTSISSFGSGTLNRWYCSKQKSMHCGGTSPNSSTNSGWGTGPHSSPWPRPRGAAGARPTLASRRYERPYRAIRLIAAPHSG